MSDDLRAAGHAAVDALADALTSAQSTNADLLVVQGQDQATIKAQADQITALEAKLNPPPVIAAPSKAVIGASLFANGTSEMHRVATALGVNDFRVYDGAKGPATLLAQITPLLAAGGNLAASFHFGDINAVHAFTAGTAAQSVYDAVNGLLKLPIVLIPEHEPDQKNRVPGPDWIAMAKKVRAMRDALGSAAKAEIWLCLTGSSPDRAISWFPGKGVLDGIGWDPYSNSTDVQAVCLPFAQAVKKLDPTLEVGVFEYGPFKYQDKAKTQPTTLAQTKAVVASIDPVKLAAMGVTRFFWFDNSFDAGMQISNDTAVATAFKAVATSSKGSST